MHHLHYGPWCLTLHMSPGVHLVAHSPWPTVSGHLDIQHSVYHQGHIVPGDSALVGNLDGYLLQGVDIGNSVDLQVRGDLCCALASQKVAAAAVAGCLGLLCCNLSSAARQG